MLALPSGLAPEVGGFIGGASIPAAVAAGGKMVNSAGGEDGEESGEGVLPAPENTNQMLVELSLLRLKFTSLGR